MKSIDLSRELGAAAKKAVHASIKPARGEARGALWGISGAGARAA